MNLLAEQEKQDLICEVLQQVKLYLQTEYTEHNFTLLRLLVEKSRHGNVSLHYRVSLFVEALFPRRSVPSIVRELVEEEWRTHLSSFNISEEKILVALASTIVSYLKEQNILGPLLSVNFYMKRNRSCIKFIDTEKRVLHRTTNSSFANSQYLLGRMFSRKRLAKAIESLR